MTAARTAMPHQQVERGKICTLPPFGEEGGRIHRRQLFRCPLYGTLHNAIELTSSYELAALASQA